MGGSNLTTSDADEAFTAVTGEVRESQNLIYLANLRRAILSDTVPGPEFTS